MLVDDVACVTQLTEPFDLRLQLRDTLAPPLLGRLGLEVSDLVRELLDLLRPLGDGAVRPKADQVALHERVLNHVVKGITGQHGLR